MTTKQWIMISTIVIMITLNGGPGKDGLRTADAASLAFLDTTASTADRDEAPAAASCDPLDAAIGEDADNVIYYSLLEGKSLAEVADDHEADVDSLIQYQVSQLSAQLDERLASGSISEETHAAQSLELYEIVSRSVHGL